MTLLKQMGQKVKNKIDKSSGIILGRFEKMNI